MSNTSPTLVYGTVDEKSHTAMDHDRAQRKIVKALRAYQARKALSEKKLDTLPESKLPLYFAIKKIKEASDEYLYAGRYDSLVSSCILRAEKTMNRAALRWLCYSLFSRLTPLGQMVPKSLKFLRNVFDNDKVSVPELAAIIRAAYREWKQDGSQSIEILAGINKDLENPTGKGKEYPFRQGQKKEIYVTHGGGLWFLRDFIAKRNQGYRGCEYEGPAIFFSPRDDPHNNDRLDIYYANRAIGASMDIPIRLRGKISAEVLIQVPNSYEAALRYQNFDKMSQRYLESTPADVLEGRYEKSGLLIGSNIADLLGQLLQADELPPHMLNKLRAGKFPGICVEKADSVKVTDNRNEKPIVNSLEQKTHAKVKMPYIYGQEHSTRKHAMTAKCPESDLIVIYNSADGTSNRVQLFSTQEKAVGDALKYHILQKIQATIEQILNHDDGHRKENLAAFRKALVKSSAYAILARSQDIFTDVFSFLGVQTDSVKAVKAMFKEAKNIVNRKENTTNTWQHHR